MVFHENIFHFPIVQNSFETDIPVLPFSIPDNIMASELQETNEISNFDSLTNIDTNGNQSREGQLNNALPQ